MKIKATKNIIYRIGSFFGYFQSIFNPFKNVLVYLVTGYYMKGVTYSSPPFILGKPRIISPNQIIIGKDFSALEGLRIEVFNKKNDPVNKTRKIIIGDNVNLNRNVHIGAINKISIGDNVLIGSNVLITDHNHSIKNTGLFRNGALTSKGSVTIGRNTWIGENVCILGGVSIGENSIIGCNTVVTKTIPKNSVVVGGGNRIL